MARRKLQNYAILRVKLMQSVILASGEKQRAGRVFALRGEWLYSAQRMHAIYKTSTKT